MSIRVKLIATYLAVALLVPVLGGIAVGRVSEVDGSIGALGRDAVPALATVKALEQSHAEQSSAALTFLAGGGTEERQRFLDRSREFDRDLKKLLPDGGAEAAGERARAARRVAEERAAFLAAAEQVLSARAALDRDLDELQRTHAAIVSDLSLLRRRAAGGEPASLPAAARRERGDLLLGAGGMLEVVQEEQALATGYALRPDQALRARFDVAGLQFSAWLQMAISAATAEERQTLARVESMFFQEYEPRARSLLVTAGFAAQARAVFTTASAALGDRLGPLAVASASATEAASGDAERASEHAAVAVLLITALAFLLAGGLGLWFSGTITRPIVRLRNAADRLSSGDLQGADLDISSNDEIGELARSFRRMALSVRILSAGTAVESHRRASR